MALGTSSYNRDNGNSKKVYDKTYYSRLKFRNPDTKVVLGFSFSAGMLIVGLSQADDNNQYTSIIDCKLTGLKARVLLHEYNQFNNDFANKKIKNSGCGYGVTTGMSAIVTILGFCVVDGSKAIAIGKVDESGKVIELHKFKFNDQFHYGLEWSDMNNMVVEKRFYPDIEFDAFGTILQEFINSYGGAAGYIQADLTKYDFRHIDNSINAVLKGLGVQVPSSVSGGNYGKARGYFNTPASNNASTQTHSNSTTIDDIENGLEGDD